MNSSALPALVQLAFVVSLGFGFAVTGCAADASADASNAPTTTEDGAVDELNAQSLRSATAVKGTVEVGSTVTLQYDSSDRVYPRSVPYLAVEIVAAAPEGATQGGALHTMSGGLGGDQTITVHGDFPGKPRVLVVDESFKTISSAVAQTLPDGTAQATVDVARGAGKRFVLVRDTRWSKPMEFQVGVGR